MKEEMIVNVIELNLNVRVRSLLCIIGFSHLIQNEPFIWNDMVSFTWDFLTFILTQFKIILFFPFPHCAWIRLCSQIVRHYFIGETEHFSFPLQQFEQIMFR